VGVTAATAVAWSLSGAVERARVDSGGGVLYGFFLVPLLQVELPDATTWNDQPFRTKIQVLQKIDQLSRKLAENITNLLPWKNLTHEISFSREI
jgi:hypothetical protein